METHPQHTHTHTHTQGDKHGCTGDTREQENTRNTRNNRKHGRGRDSIEIILINKYTVMNVIQV